MNCNRCKEEIRPSDLACMRCDCPTWHGLCPPLYAATDPKRLPKEGLAKVLAWKYGSRGLLVYGPSGKGKTRSAFLLLKRLYDEGLPIIVYDSITFGHAVAEKFGDNGDGVEWIESLYRRKLVFLDDIDKMRLTERVQSELFGLIEKRISNLLPTILTTNCNDAELESHFSPHIGPGLVRRLAEFCDVVKF